MVAKDIFETYKGQGIEMKEGDETIKYDSSLREIAGDDFQRN